MRLTGFAFLALTAVLQAEAPCPSAEACLAKSLERDWDQYQTLLERAAADRARVAALLRRAASVGTAADMAALKGEQARIEERWRFALAVAHALTEPRFKAFLVEERDEAARLHAAARERAGTTLELYRRLGKNTLGPERASVIRDIGGFEREALDLRKTFYRDGFMVSLSSLKETGGLMTEAWVHFAEVLSRFDPEHGAAIARTVPYVRGLNFAATLGHASAEAVHAGMSVKEAQAKGQGFRTLLETAKGAGQFTLFAAEFIAKAPESPLKREFMREAFGAAALRAGTYLNVITLGLDTLLTVAATGRLKDAEARQVRVETDDAAWRAKVDAATRAAADTAARERRADRQLEREAAMAARLDVLEREAR